jgi:hypothetical protein
VHKCVVGACPSRGNHAIALGFDIGGRVAGVHPQQMRAGLRPALFLSFVSRLSRGGMDTSGGRIVAGGAIGPIATRAVNFVLELGQAFVEPFAVERPHVNIDDLCQ